MRDALDHHFGRDAEREVNLAAPAWPVLPDRRREHQLPAVAEPSVDAGDAERPERG